jgi:23S rRNA pseudouridine1911/1915/1917 synthase
VLIVDASETGRRLDLYLVSRLAPLSRTKSQKLIEEGLVLVNGVACLDKSRRLLPDDQVTVTLPDPEPYLAKPEPIPLEIIYEDADLLVINKPRGMVIHPAPGHRQGTLVNALLHYCSRLSGLGGVNRPGIVHRLDKDTTGLLIVAKSDFAHQGLAEQLKDRRLRREYLALVQGAVSPRTGSIDAPIGRHPVHRKKMAVVPGGRVAVTRYRVIGILGRFTLVRVSLETGRTHQVRVHMAFLGHPVAGDPVYSRAAAPPPLSRGQALHACRIAFTHPRTGNLMEFAAPLPSDFRETLRYLRKQGR